jgi:hypothetical protein
MAVLARASCNLSDRPTEPLPKFLVLRVDSLVWKSVYRAVA